MDGRVCGGMPPARAGATTSRGNRAAGGRSLARISPPTQRTAKRCPAASIPVPAGNDSATMHLPEALESRPRRVITGTNLPNVAVV